MIDTLPKIIHDTLYVKSPDALDLLNKTNEFYDSAWNKLIITASVIVIVVAFVVPYLINLYQKKIIERDKRELKDEIKKELSEAQMELSQEIRKELTTLITTVDERQSAFNFYAQGLVYYQTNDHNRAFVSLLRAAFHFALVKDYYNEDLTLDAMEQTRSFINKRGIEDAKKHMSPHLGLVPDLFTEIRNIADEKLINIINKMEALYNSIPEENDAAIAMKSM